RRLSHVRCFARYLHALDAAHQIPPVDSLAHGSRRTTPYPYSDQQIAGVLDAAGAPRYSQPRATARTPGGLPSVTGMRVGEALRLDRGDLDLRHGTLTVRNSKFGKSRLVPLHPSTVRALRRYLRRRDQHPHGALTEAVFISMHGRRWDH